MANLYYIIGASGVGKDSLIHYARQKLSENGTPVFAHRYITRPANAVGENHIALCEEEFQSRRKSGCFAMHWESHNTGYGVGIEINQWLSKGLDVVVNGSRVHLSRASQDYPELVPVLIHASEERLRERLLARGREHGSDIEARLSRAVNLDKHTDHPRLVRIENEGILSDAGDCLVKLLRENVSEICA